MIPFGSRTLALAHIKVKNSPTLAYKCFPMISMGWTGGVIGGIVLKNLVTNRNSIIHFVLTTTYKLYVSTIV
jgi:hypothetical protein